MIIRLASVALVTLIIGGAGYLYQLTGALVALPAALLISFGTEKLINKVRPSQSLESLQRR